MAKKQVENINTLTAQELVSKIEESTLRIQKLKFAHAVTPLENPMHIRAERKQIARLQTALTKQKNVK
jgi:large subunit ribosomal protein L29